jgi:hypothetical protein
MRCRTVFLGLALLVLVPGCNSDKVLAGRQILERDPGKAVAMFRAAVDERPDCFECLAYLGYGLQRQGDMLGASQAYEKAAALPGAATRTEPVLPRLLDAYESLFQASTEPSERLELARKAAPIEVTLKVSRPWANIALADITLARMRSATEAGNADGIRKASEELQALYLPAERKKQDATEATESLRKVFIARIETAFAGELGARLAQAGRFESESMEITLTNEFRIPAASEDSAFDPKSEGFRNALRQRACLPLRAAMEDTVNDIAPGIGIRKPESDGLDRVFARLFRSAKAGFSVYGAENRANPAGLPYVCTIRISLKEFAGELFRFSE